MKGISDNGDDNDGDMEQWKMRVEDGDRTEKGGECVSRGW